MKKVRYELQYLDNDDLYHVSSWDADLPTLGDKQRFAKRMNGHSRTNDYRIVELIPKVVYPKPKRKK